MGLDKEVGPYKPKREKRGGFGVIWMQISIHSSLLGSPSVVSEGVLPPQHAAAHDPLGVIVRRLDPLATRERPQRRIQRQQVLAGRRRLGVGAAAAPLQRRAEPAG